VKPVIFLVLLAALCTFAGCGSNGTASDDIVARVNSKEITTADLEKEYQNQINGAQQVPTPEEAQALKFQLLSQMINDEILLQMAASSGLNATDAEVETKFTDLKSKFTEEQFQEELKRQKMTADDIKAQMRKGLTVEKLITREITQRINVSDAEIADLYEKNKASFNLPKGYRLQHIMVTPFPEQINNARRDDARNAADARTKAERLFREVRGGIDFGVVARDWSEDVDSAPNGGDLGFRPIANIEEIDPKLAQAVRSLKIGETSQLIETKYGFHILKLLNEDSGGQKDLKDAQVQAQIREVIFNRKQEMLRAAFSETARNKAQITNYLAERLLESVGKASAPVAGAPASPAAVPPAPAPPAETKPEEKKPENK
jgi:peptidyl-prolyl cis-trans isomerase SurA